jgi:hypothetical protein
MFFEEEPGQPLSSEAPHQRRGKKTATNVAKLPELYLFGRSSALSFSAGSSILIGSFASAHVVLARRFFHHMDCRVAAEYKWATE